MATTELTFGYSDSEDRLWLKSSDGAHYWLTRRLLLNFLGPAADLLERTVPGGEVPNALPASLRVGLEHAEALADTPEGQPAMQRDKETRGSATEHGAAIPALANTISVRVDAEGCRLSLVAAGREGHLNLNRLDFHRLLGAMHLASAQAGWNLPGLPDWLGEAPAIP
jgi:hypothetical protein